MSDFVVVESESRAAGSRGARAAAHAPSGRLGGRRRGTEEAERRTKAFCHGVEGGVPEEGDRVAFEWKMDEGELFHECLARYTISSGTFISTRVAVSVNRHAGAAHEEGEGRGAFFYHTCKSPQTRTLLRFHTPGCYILQYIYAKTDAHVPI